MGAFWKTRMDVRTKQDPRGQPVLRHRCMHHSEDDWYYQQCFLSPGALFVMCHQDYITCEAERAELPAALQYLRDRGAVLTGDIGWYCVDPLLCCEVVLSGPWRAYLLWHKDGHPELLIGDVCPAYRRKDGNVELLMWNIYSVYRQTELGKDAWVFHELTVTTLSTKAVAAEYGSMQIPYTRYDTDIDVIERFSNIAECDVLNRLCKHQNDSVRLPERGECVTPFGWC